MCSLLHSDAIVFGVYSQPNAPLSNRAPEVSEPSLGAHNFSVIGSGVVARELSFELEDLDGNIVRPAAFARQPDQLACSLLGIVILDNLQNLGIAHLSP